MIKLVLFLALFLFNACGDGKDPDPISQDPETIVTTEFFGQNGNLWKPSGDAHASSAGLLVILLGPHHTEKFNYCELELHGDVIEMLDCNDRVPWTDTPYSCFANGDRQHWRSGVECNEALEVLVRCFKPNQEVIFTVPEEQRHLVCNRFG